MDVKTLEAEYVSEISDQLNKGELVSFACQNSRDLIFTIATKPLDYREEKSGASFPKPRSKLGQNYSVYQVIGGEVIHSADIINEPFNIHFAQALGNDKLLLSSARSRFRNSDDFDKNGRIYDLSGQFLNETLLGDGIQDLQISRNGTIWTSYCDEGVFGNFGWNSPVGASGLIAWDKTGEQIYSYEPKSGLDYIVDCYALNVESDSLAWFYYYTEFQLVKINNFDVVEYWNIPVKGSDSFAIYKNYALFQGGYDDRNSFYLVELKAGNNAKVLCRLNLKNIASFDWVVGRGETVYILSGTEIYKVELRSLISS